MQTMRNNTKTAAVIATVLLLASVTLMTMPVQAQKLPSGVTPTNLQTGASVPLPPGVTPALTLDTTAYLSFRPNPIGLGQPLLVNMWLTPSTHVSHYFTGYTVTITKPDRTTVTVGPMNSYGGDTSAWFEYTVDQVGTWTLKFDMPGGYFPPGNYSVYAGSTAGEGVYSFPESCYYKPSSTAEQTLVVQEEQVLSWPPAALPTDYWTRPAPVVNREWWPILGNYPATGYFGGNDPEWDARYPDTNPYWSSRYQFTPWVQGPNSAHIVWKRQGDIAGLAGGQMGPMSFTADGNFPTIIYSGRCYQTDARVSPTGTSSQNYWMCYDLRTGEVYWERPLYPGESAPTLIDYGGITRYQVPGAEGAGYAGTLVYVGGGRLIQYSPWTGAVNLNLSIAPLTTGTFYKPHYFLSVQNLGSTVPVAQRYRLINWTYVEYYGTPSYVLLLNNITWPWSSLPATTDFESGIAVNIVRASSPISGTYSLNYEIRAASLITGAELWNITDTDGVYSGSCAVADHGKIAILTEKGYWKAWDLDTGRLAWKGEVMAYPWGSCSFSAYAVQSAYGLLYGQSYAGIYAFNWTNGKIVWRYQAPGVPFEGTYAGYYPWDVNAIIADGKMYVQNAQHGVSMRVDRGWSLHCINATTGEGIWRITGSSRNGIGPVADGYLTVSNIFDGYMYVFGKGKSATTITVSPKTIAKGAEVLIEGTVLDQSPGQPGTPCVSKESMTTQMEYLHMQQPIDGIWHNETITGVPVMLTAIGSDGTVIDLGTVTTNGYYGAFGYAWTPQKEDTYTIMASFAGDDSYGSSSAATGLSVGPAPASPTPTPTPQPQAAPDNTPLIAATAAIILAVAIVGMLILRKRQ